MEMFAALTRHMALVLQVLVFGFVFDHVISVQSVQKQVLRVNLTDTLRLFHSSAADSHSPVIFGVLNRHVILF